MNKSQYWSHWKKVKLSELQNNKYWECGQYVHRLGFKISEEVIKIYYPGFTEKESD